MQTQRVAAATLLLIGTLGARLSTAQERKVIPAASAKAASAPVNLLLAADDGLAVIAAALDSRNYVSSKADCSHLVHDIYQRAGFSYTYVPSTDLYSGIADFQRVSRPQPGDLIVWPGHVGIVVSPAKHTFYSSLRSGLGVEPYDSDYWKQRGRPRFFRYVKDASAVPVGSARAATLKSTSLDAKTPLVETTEVETPPTPAAPRSTEPIQFPRLLTIQSERPTTEDVSEAIMNALGQTAEALRGKSILGQPQTFVVVGRIQVERTKIKGVTGWADVVTNESASLIGGQSNLKKHQQKQRWLLRRRDAQSWDIVPPQGTAYLNQEDAIRLLSQQLAAMTAEDSSSDARQKAQVAALLGALLQVKN